MADDKKTRREREEAARKMIAEIHGVAVALFAAKARSAQVTVEQIAQRLKREPAEIVQWITSSKGWTMDRIADFFVAMGCEPRFAIKKMSAEAPDVQRAINLLRGADASYAPGDFSATRMLIRNAVWALGGSFDAE